MERNINDINREPIGLRAAGFFGDLTKKLVSSAGEKAASAIGSKAGEALGNKFFNRKKEAKSASPIKKESNSSEGAPKKAASIVEENKGSELIKLLQVENKLSPQSNIHEIYYRLLNQE